MLSHLHSKCSLTHFFNIWMVESSKPGMAKEQHIVSCIRWPQFGFTTFLIAIATI